MAAIWIDLDNSPHVPLFAPIIRHYRDSGVDVILTARDHSQTIELLNLYEFQGTYTVIGRHYGKSKIDKIRGSLGTGKAARFSHQEARQRNFGRGQSRLAFDGSGGAMAQDSGRDDVRLRIYRDAHLQYLFR